MSLLTKYGKVVPGKAIIADKFGDVDFQGGTLSNETNITDLQDKISPQQIVTVAQVGGEYSLIQDAIDSITDAGSGKIYAVLVYPGVYDERLTLKDYVNIIAVDPFETLISKGITDNGANVHCSLKINIGVGTSVSYDNGVRISGSSSDVFIEGNIKGGLGSGDHSTDNGVYISGGGSLMIVGNVTGGAGLDYPGYGFQNSASTLKIQGNVTAGVKYGNHSLNYTKGSNPTTIVTDGTILGQELRLESNGGQALFKRCKIIGTPGDAVEGHPSYTSEAHFENISIEVQDGDYHGIYAYALNLILKNVTIVHTASGTGKSIYSNQALDVKCLNVWANRDLDANVTNLIAGGFTYDTDVE